MSVHWPIIKRLAANPLRVAVVDDVRSYRGIDLLIAAMHVADAIDSCCSTKTVGMMLPTSGAAPICLLAGWMTGRTVVPLNFLLEPEQLQYVVDDCGTDTIFTVGKLTELMPALPRVENFRKLEDIEMRAVPAPRWPAGAAPEDLACLLYTSGTSGRPKGVMLTHGNLRANVGQILRRVALTEDDALVGVLPQFHSFGLTALTLMPLTRGVKAVYTARFVPTKLVGLFREHRPTLFVGIPSMFGAMLNLKKGKPEDFASLAYAVSGGEPLPDAVARGFRERYGITISEGYGLTETSPVTNWCTPADYKPHSVGPALPGLEQIVVDPNTGGVLGPNLDGELRMRGPNVMPGYFNLPDETAQAFDDNGYFRTGDMARIDDDGHVFITGRIKEMMIVAGENVFPREIEEVLNRHPAVNATGVVGMQCDLRGEVPVAFVELVEGESLAEPEIKSFARQGLAGYKVPKEFRFLEALPRNPTGKIMRRELVGML